MVRRRAPPFVELHRARVDEYLIIIIIVIIDYYYLIDYYHYLNNHNHNYHHHDLAPSRREAEELGRVRRRQPERRERPPRRDSPRVRVERTHHSRVLWGGVSV